MSTFGKNTIGATSTTINNNKGYLSSFVAGASITLTEMFAYIGGQAGTNVNVLMRIFPDTAGTPGSALGACPTIPIVGAVASAWINAAFASPVPITIGSTYWLSAEAINNGGSSGVVTKFDSMVGSSFDQMTANTNPPSGVSILVPASATSVYADDAAIGAIAHNLSLLGVGT